MARHVQHVVQHLGARIGSVILSFLLFAWIGRVLPVQDATKAYFFSFSLGFGLATARMTLQLGAAVNGAARSVQRMREAYRGYTMLIYILPFLATAVGVIAWNYTSYPSIVLLAVVVTLFASADVDLLRGVVQKSSIFATSFSLGSMLSLVSLQWLLPHTLNGVIVALLVQWLPVCVLNMPAVRRLLSVNTKTKVTISMILGTLFLTGFDGLVLNAPFLGLLQSTVQESLDLSLIMRIFIASLPMLPLMLHWCNSTEFDNLCKKINVSQKKGFLLGLMITGILAGGTFLAIYTLVAHHTVSNNVFVLYVLLLLAYSTFAPQMRFSATLLSPKKRVFVLGAIALMYLAVLILAVQFGYAKTYMIIFLQSITLICAAMLLHLFAATEDKVKKLAS